MFWKRNTINFINLINFKIDNYITAKDIDIWIARKLKYYKFKNNEYLLSLLVNKNSEIINIYELNNNLNIKFTIDNDRNNDIEMQDCFLFYYQNNL